MGVAKYNYGSVEPSYPRQGMDVSVVEELIGKYKQRVYAYIFTAVKDSVIASDLLQETMLKAYASMRRGGYRESGRFEPWVIRVARNVLMDHYRRRSRASIVQSESDWQSNTSYVNSDRSPEQEVVWSESRHEVRRMVEKLPTAQRDVVILRYYLGMSFQEIAEYQGVSINTALGRMRYSLINLRKMMGVAPPITG